MKKKNLLAILCALLLVIGIFTGCAAQTTTASPETEDAAKTEDVTKTENTVETEASTADSSKPLAGKKIGFAHLTLFDEWCISVADAMEQIGKEYGADEVNIQVAEFDLETQVKQIENFINQEYDAIFILTSFTDAILPYVQQATDAGIPVIAMDGTLEGPPLVSHIVWDQAYTGKVLAEKAGDYIENELNGEARIVCLDSKSLEYMAVRQKAFLETLDERFGDKITIVNDSDCQTREEAMNTIVSISDSYDLVYAASDSNAHGAVAGMQSKGITGVPIYACGGFGEELYKAITDPDSPFFAVINIPGESIVSSAYEMLLKYLNGDTDIPEHVNCEVLYVDKNSPEDVLATLKP